MSSRPIPSSGGEAMPPPGNGDNTYPYGAYGPPQDASLEGVIGVLRRRKMLIIGIAFIGTVVAALAGFQLTPKYTAKALLLIAPPETNVVGIQAVMAGLPADATTVETQLKVLTSRSHLQAVIASANLEEDVEFRPEPPSADMGLTWLVEDPWRKLVGWMPERWLIAAGFADEPLMQLAAPEPTAANELSFGEAARHNDIDLVLVNVARRLKAQQEGRSYVVGVSFTSTSPEKAAMVANTAVGLYVDRQLQQKRAATNKASAWLGERVDALRREVELAERAVKDYRITTGLVDARRTDVTDQQVADLNKELVVAEADLAGRQARLAFVRGLRQRGDALDSLPEALSSLTIVELRRQEAELTRAEAELGGSLGAKHPRMQLIIAERDKLAEKIRSEVNRIVSNLENETQIASAQVASIRSSLASAQSKSSTAQTAEIRLNELEREAQATRQLYESFLQRFKETREQQEIIEPDSRIISHAAPPSRPSSPGVPLFAALGLTVSTLLGTMLAFLIERLDKGLRSEVDIHSALGLPRIGLVPRLGRLPKRQRPHQYLLQHPLSAYTEAIRAILASLKLNDGETPAKTLLVTSSVPGEGKTTLAVSLAIYAARSGQSVLLVDLDLRHPSVLRELRSPASAGIVEHLLHEAPLQEVIDYDPELGLDLIVVREQPSDPMPLVTSKRMAEFLRQMRDSYDYVVIDSAPLLGVTDAQLLAPQVDKVLLVVQWGKTPRSLSQSAMSLLRTAKADVAGVVLTQVDVERHARYGYGDVGDYYGKYSKYYSN